MNEKRYQIFISSTFEDLRSEREEATRTILKMGHIPVGMEMFNAGNASQWEVIKRTIENCDYYMVILGFRYGSISDDTKLSYTEMEYDYATSLGIPVLGMVISKDLTISTDAPDHWKEDFYSNKRLMSKFRDKVQSKIVDFWNNADDLGKKCALSLNEMFTINPRPGWIRSNEAVSPELANQLSKLLSENAELKLELDKLKSGMRLDFRAREASKAVLAAQKLQEIKYVF